VGIFRRCSVTPARRGVGYAMQDVHAYVAAKVRGERSKRPSPAQWRK